MTDRNDGTASSSEELIRQARRAYEPTTEEAESPSSAYSAHGTIPTRAAADDRPAVDPATVSRPADYLREDYRESTYPGGSQPGVPAGGTYQEQRPSLSRRFGGLLIVGAIVIGFAVFSMFDRTKQVDDLAVGDCLLMPANEEITEVESAECTDPHELEVFHLVTLGDAAGAPYPGEDAVFDEIIDQCVDRFESYVAFPYEDSVWWVNAIYPTPDSWEEGDDRAGTCVLFQPGLGEDPLTLTGSARNSAE